LARVFTADVFAADVNPIGGISKTDLKRFLTWAQEKMQLPILSRFLTAVPTAELEPFTETYLQADEVSRVLELE
jgi:NAD+ synthase (glutamine-hydrolysing)